MESKYGKHESSGASYPLTSHPPEISTAMSDSISRKGAVIFQAIAITTALAIISGYMPYQGSLDPFHFLSSSIRLGQSASK